MDKRLQWAVLVWLLSTTFGGAWWASSIHAAVEDIRDDIQVLASHEHDDSGAAVVRP